MSRSGLFAATAVLLLSGCNDDEKCVVCPPEAQPPVPTLANIWPHTDGAQWIYDFTFEQYAGPSVSEVPPPMPSATFLHTALQSPIQSELLTSDAGLYRLQFDGEVTTESGVTAQNLVGGIYTEDDGTRIVDSRRSLLLAIAQARPNCREAILARLDVTAGDDKSFRDARGPCFLGAYAFAFEDSGYFGYGDLDDDHSWTYLAGDLTAGTEFAVQVLRELVDDLWLRGRIWSVGERVVDGVTWSNVVECMYTLDLGPQYAVDEDGNVIGMFRAYIYGTALFVPEVGPIASDERHVTGPQSILQNEPMPIVQEYRCRLAGPIR